ncbi:MAG: diguanylate cyclase response regulator, partial [SAR86 cluster bacterium]
NSLPVSILAISSYEDNARTLSLFQAGVNDYVRKPVIDQELLARVDNLVLNHRLLKELEEQQQHLERIAMTDQLTGLYNRHYLMDVAQKKIASIKRHSVKLSLIVIDIDFFKKINDAHGHTMGDLILTQVGGLFKELTRDEDVVARIGGEEFVILLDACSLKHAFTKAEEIRKALEEANFENLNVTASFGVAQYGEDDKDFGALFMRADKATYLAKDNGRNTVATD